MTGGFATALSIRWHAQVMGWLGLLGALWAPGLLGAGDGSEHVFLLIAYSRDRGRAGVAALDGARRLRVLQRDAAVGGLARRRARAARAHAASALLAAALAFGFEANRRGLHPVVIGPQARTRPSWFAASVLVIDAALLALAGWYVLDGELWLTALAVVHIGLGLVATRRHRGSRASSR